MKAVEQFKDIEKIRAEAANLLFDAAVHFIASLDQWAACSNPAHSAADVAYCQHQKRTTLAFLYRSFPDQAATIAEIG